MSGAFDMGEAVRPSALIKTARWSLLVVGIWWGYRRFGKLKIEEDALRAYNARMKPIWDKEAAEKKAKVDRANMLQLAKEVGVKYDENEHKQMHTDIINEAISNNCVLCKK